MEAPTPASDAADLAPAPSDVSVQLATASPQRKRLPAPSTPTSSVRRKMASNGPSSASKDPVPPRRPTATSGTATAGARRPTASASSARASTTASKPLSSAASRTSTVGSSLNKPPTRPAPGTAARRTGLAGKTASSDAEPELSSVTSGDENRKPTARRTPATSGATTRASPGKTTSRPSIAPSSSTTTSAKRPLTARPAADASTTRPTPRASLASSRRTTTTRPATTTRTAPGTAAKAPIAHAKKLSVTAAPSAPDARDTAPEELSSPIDVPPRSNGPLKDKAASDAEVEIRKSALSPVKAALAKLGEATQRPGTAPSGPAEMDAETKRRSVEIMQDFFKETNLREQLQEQCDDLGREVDNLQSEKAKLRKQLAEAQAAIVEKDKAIAGASQSTELDQSAHTTLVEDMEKKFAQETKQLEEQSQQLEVEKKAAQDKSALEATRAAELQQVLDDLNNELEQQGRQWDAEKKKLVEQATQLEQLTKEVATLKDERDSLTKELASAKETLESHQKKLAEIEHSQSDTLKSREDKIDELTKTIDHLRSELATSEQHHGDALQEAQRSLDSQSSEFSGVVQELQSKVELLQQEHTEQLRLKDETIASHVKTQKELQDDIVKLQQRADQATADLESERTAHAESIQQKIDELQKSSQNELRIKEDEVSGHLKSIDGLQEQIKALQQGSTDGAKVAEELHKQIVELKQSHEAAIKVKTDENNELVQQLDAINDQLGADAAELEQLKDETEGLRKTIQTLEQASQQAESQHAANVAKVHAELNEVEKKAESYKTELEATQDKHRQDLRTLGEDHEGEIESLRSDLEGDAKNRLNKLQAEFDSLVAEKNATLEQHEKVLCERAQEIETLKHELSTLKERSGSASQSLTDAVAKHKQAEEEKASLEEAHTISQKLVADLQARVDALTKEVAVVEDLQGRLDSLQGEKSAAEDAHAKSQKIVTELQARHDALLEEKTAAEDAHSRAVEALKQDSESTSKRLLGDLQSKYEALLGEKHGLEKAHKTEIENLQIQRDTFSKQLSDLEGAHSDVLVEKSTTQELHAKALDAQQAEIEQKYANLVEALQADTMRLEQEKSAAVSDKQSALNELVGLKKDLHAEIDELKAELGSKEESGSAGLAEATKQYEALLAEKDEADKVHEAAIALVRDSLKEDHLKVLSELQSKYDTLQQKLAETDQEHGDAIELLKEEFRAGHSNDIQTLQQQLEALQKQHIDLSEQKAYMDKAHEEAISELMVGMEASTSDAVQQLQKKYDALAAELETAKLHHSAELEATKQDVTEQQTLYRDLLVRHDKATADVDANAADVKRLMKTIHEVETERDQAIKAAEEAEDRIETMKGEVVRKHLARVEPLERENAVLSDKVERLEAIIAAGDRVARAAASMGEKRNINTLAEEDEETDEDVKSGAQLPKLNGLSKDVVGTLAAMQETLNQLSELNNDAIAESSRTAQRLTEQD